MEHQYCIIFQYCRIIDNEWCIRKRHTNQHLIRDSNKNFEQYLLNTSILFFKSANKQYRTFGRTHNSFKYMHSRLLTLIIRGLVNVLGRRKRTIPSNYTNTSQQVKLWELAIMWIWFLLFQNWSLHDWVTNSSKSSIQNILGSCARYIQTKRNFFVSVYKE